MVARDAYGNVQLDPRALEKELAELAAAYAQRYLDLNHALAECDRYRQERNEALRDRWDDWAQWAAQWIEL